MIERLKYKGIIGFYLYLFLYKIYRYLKYDRLSDDKFIKTQFKKRQGFDIDLASPKSLNEKINWLKLNFSHPLESVLADKFMVRDYIKDTLGSEYLIPLIFETTYPNEIIEDSLPNFPFIIKANHDSGSYLIVKDKSKVNWKKLKIDAKFWLSRNYYWVERERQYKNIKPRIIIEKLLICKNGKIPNDYKLHCINGRVEFIYVSIDREGNNKRNIYSNEWIPLEFTWASSKKETKNLRGEEIPKPDTLNEMIFLAEKLALGFPYVRIDFYDVDGKIFFGEITQHHGGGFDRIQPLNWDYFYGEKINLSNA